MVKGDSHQAGKASEMENLRSEYLFMNRTERRAANSCEEGGKWVENEVIFDVMHSLVYVT